MRRHKPLVNAMLPMTDEEMHQTISFLLRLIEVKLATTTSALLHVDGKIKRGHVITYNSSHLSGVLDINREAFIFNTLIEKYPNLHLFTHEEGFVIFHETTPIEAEIAS